MQKKNKLEQIGQFITKILCKITAWSHLTFKYIQQNPAGVSSVPVSEPSASSNFGCDHSSESVRNIWTLCQPDGGSGLPQMLDWNEISALTWPPQSIDPILFEPSLCSVCCMLGVAHLLTDRSHSSLQAFLACCWQASSLHNAATILHMELVCLQCSFLSLFLLFCTAVYWFFKQDYKTTYDMKNDESAWMYLSLFTRSITHITWSIFTEFGAHTVLFSVFLGWFFLLLFFVIFTLSQSTHSTLQEWTVLTQTELSSGCSKPCKVTPAAAEDMLY